MRMDDAGDHVINRSTTFCQGIVISVGASISGGRRRPRTEREGEGEQCIHRSDAGHVVLVVGVEVIDITANIARDGHERFFELLCAVAETAAELLGVAQRRELQQRRGEDVAAGVDGLLAPDRHQPQDLRSTRAGGAENPLQCRLGPLRWLHAHAIDLLSRSVAIIRVVWSRLSRGRWVAWIQCGYKERSTQIIVRNQCL
mmetsp:Transcript_4955/g.15660  ORF Transcript_4955/g.15660 Transcript_4955/m.15660 type:complete len:200 (+) Transcript_4955:2055-2654(+)